MRFAIPSTLALAIAAAAFADGKPGKAKQAALIEEGSALFATNCASCHGPAGMGDGPAAAALDPKPRNLADAAYMKTRPDATLRKVIAEGGQSVGLSPIMIAWQGALKPEQIDAVLAYVRSLPKAKKKPAAK